MHVSEWLDGFDEAATLWYVKRLAANDTLASEAHQAGPYVPRRILFAAWPQLDTAATANPELWIDLRVESHDESRRARAVYYNARRRGTGTKDEARITNLGGRESALLDPENTGAMAVFAFPRTPDLRVWICRNAAEEEEVQDRFGNVDPGEYVFRSPDQPLLFDSSPESRCRLTADTIPPEWLVRFPSGEQVIRKSVELQPCSHLPADARLLRRRKCEFEMFRSIEEAICVPRIRKGFEDMQSFLALAQSVLQARKARSGNSLELHVREILTEEGLRPGIDFQYKPAAEEGKRPDFLFPSQAAYADVTYPAAGLRMLGVKTTCKDRWRQILTEADRIPRKHLLTLQEGVSEAQLREMQGEGVQLVVPRALHGKFPSAVRPHLIDLARFIEELRGLSIPFFLDDGDRAVPLHDRVADLA